MQGAARLDSRWEKSAAAKSAIGLLILLVVGSACVAARTPGPPLSPRLIHLEATTEEDVDSREIPLLWQDLTGAGVEFQLPLVRPVTYVLFRVPQAADFWVRCRQLNGDLELSLGYVNDEPEKDHKIRPHFWKTANRAELLIDATWQENAYYVLDAKAEVHPEAPLVLIIQVYGSR